MNSRLILAVFLHTLLATCSHYHIAVLNSLEPFIKSFANHSINSHYGHIITEGDWSWIWALIGAAPGLGCLVTSPFTGVIVHYFGRRNSVMVVKNTCFVIACLLQFGSRLLNSVELLILGRFLVGISHPLTMLTPTFVTECAPTEYRGVSSTAVAVGLRCWLVLGPIVALPWLLGTDELWNWAPFVTTIPAFLHLLLTAFIPKSPKHLYILHNDVDGTIKALKWYHGKESDVDRILTEFDKERNLVIGGETTSLKTILQTRHLRWPFLLSVLLWAALPLSGVPIISSYSTPVIKSIGIEQQDASLFTALVLQLPSLLMSLICTLLVERCGRKILYLSGYGIVILGLFLLFVSTFFPAISSFNAVFSIIGMSLMVNGYTLGPVLGFMLPSELCPAAIKAKTIAFSQFTCYLLLTITMFCFPPLFNMIGNYVLLPLLGISVAIWLFVLFYFPETKGKTPEEIAVKWLQ